MSRIFWGEYDDERLYHETADDAIEAIIDGMSPVGFDEIGEITVHEFAPMTLRPSDLGSPLEGLLERLDEDYSDPDGDGTKATDRMREAEKALIEAVIADYYVWACQPTGNKVTVNALEWVKEHRPDWLKERESAEA